MAQTSSIGNDLQFGLCITVVHQGLPIVYKAPEGMPQANDRVHPPCYKQKRIQELQ